jgi:hypothetical protein
VDVAVRRESVRLDLEGNFLADIAAAAGGAAALRMELDRLGRVRISTNVNQSIGQVDQSARRAEGSINQLTGRLSLLADGLLVLGPGLVPIAAVGAQALGGLTAAATAAATAGAAAIVAFQGVGDAVKAVDAYQLEPTTANFQKMQAAMKAIGPDARTFVREFQDFQPVLTQIRDSAAAGLFPGLTASLDDFARLGPRVGGILHDVGAELGNIVGDSAASLNSERWTGFLDFLRAELPDALRSVSNIMGDLGHGAAMMFQAFDPGNDRFISWLEGVADGFDRWASSSEGRNDIRAFLEYARENGPQVADLFSSLVGALTAIVKAAAPLGGTVLSALTAVAKLIELIAESDAATPILAAVAALRIYSRVAAVATAAQTRLNTVQRLGSAPGVGASAANRNTLNTMGLTGTALGAALVAPRASDVRAQQRAQRGMYAQSAAGLAAFGLLASGAADKANLTNTAMLTLAGTMAGPVGAALGAVAGLTMDAAAANDSLTDAVEATNAALSAGDLEGGLSNLTAAKEQLDAFKATIEDGKGFSALADPGALLANTKNGIEGLFGNSDVEEAEAAIRAAEDYYNAVKRINDLKPVAPADAFNDLFNGLNGELQVTNSLLYDFSAAMAKAEGFLSKRGAAVAYEASLDAIGKALKDNGKTLDKNTEKGRANRTALDGLAESGLRFAENLRGANKTEFLDRLRGDVRRAARELGMGGDQLKTFLTQLGLVDRKKVEPEVDLDDRPFRRKHRRAEDDLNTLDASEANPFVNLFDDPFQRGRRRVEGDIDQLDISRANPFVDLNTNPFFTAMGAANSSLNSFDGRSATAFINIVSRRIGNANPFAADGGTMGRDGLFHADGGGTVPGQRQPYGDKVFAFIAPGEEVISNRYGQADRNRALLKAINANRLADGGTAGGDGSGVSLPADSSRAHRENARALKDFHGSVKAATKALEKEREQRQEMLSYRGEVAGSLSSDLTGGGLAGLDLGLAASKNDARAMVKALMLAKKKGLDGPLFDLVAASGDLSLAQQLAALSRGQIRQRERAYGATRAAENALGNLATSERFGESLAKNKADIARLEKAVERGTRRGSKEGTESGSRRAGRDRARRVNAGARAGRG